MVEYVCTLCGYEGRRRCEKRGSKGMEIFIWSVLLIPGPLYSLWRRCGLKAYCPHCGAQSMVKSTSDEGITFLHEQDKKLIGEMPQEWKKF